MEAQSLYVRPVAVVTNASATEDIVQGAAISDCRKVTSAEVVSRNNVETSNTVTVTNTTGYNAYLDLSSNTDFDDINYALIETESALISEVIASY